MTVLGPVVGAAQGALDAINAMFASDRKPFMTAYSRMGESPGARHWLAEATYLVNRAENTMLGVAREASSSELSPGDGPRLRMALADAGQDCRAAVERMLDLHGASGFDISNVLQRFWRDVAVGSRHPHLNPYLAVENLGTALAGTTEPDGRGMITVGEAAAAERRASTRIPRMLSRNMSAHSSPGSVEPRRRLTGGSSMRVLLTTQPGHGHFDPMIPYAAAFHAAGHEVRVASSEAFARTVEAAGFDFTAIGENFSWEDVETTFPEFVGFARRGQGLAYANEFSWTRWNPTAARDLIASFDSWRPDVMIREFAENGATFAGQVADIPVICASWSALPTDERRWGSLLDWPRVLDHYETVAGRFGIELDDVDTAWNRQLTLTGLPPSWFTGASTGATVRHFRLPLAEGPDKPGPAWLGALGRDRPLVYATLGTVFNRMRKPRQALVDGLAELDVDVLLTVGHTVDPDTIGPIPARMRVERFVPQAYALSRASLVVSHAGLGTMLGAIYHGVPMVSIVLGAEHPINAASAAEAGLALPLSMDEVDADRIAATSMRALHDPALRATSDAVRKECENLEAVDRVVPLAETYAKIGNDSPERCQ